MADLLEELKQDIKQEKLEAIIFKHGKKLLGLGVGVLIGAIVLVLINNYKTEKAEESGKIFLEAFTKNDAKKYDDVITAKHRGYMPMASLMKSGINFSKEKYDESIKALDEIIGSKNYDKAFQEAAILQKAFILYKTNKPEEEVLNLLNQISVEGSVFKFTAKEFKANYLMEKGKAEDANKIFEELASDENCPTSLKKRILSEKKL